jgi:ribose transport system permease protein
MLFIFDIGSAQPSDFGNFYELYAIAAAVLGGCSLRGGEASVIGVIVGAATLQVLRNTITLVGLSSQLEFAVIGAVLLIGVAADELVRRFTSRRLERMGAVAKA